VRTGDTPHFSEEKIKFMETEEFPRQEANGCKAGKELRLALEAWCFPLRHVPSSGITG
jgi:hypothetical protein